MKIAIIGTGNVGGALATQWAKAGHQILLGVRDKAQFKGKELMSNENTSVHSIEEATAFGDVSGKVIIDGTNSIRIKPENYPTATMLSKH